EEYAAREAERGIERAVERGLERGEVDAEVVQQPLGDGAVERVGRLERLAAAVTDDRNAVDRELVALGVAAEIVVVVEDEDARVVPGRAAVEPGRGEPADAAADNDEIVALLDRQVFDRIAPAVAAHRMRHFERAGVLS